MNTQISAEKIQEKINSLKGLYHFKSPYHEDKRKLPFEVIGNSYDAKFPVKTETVEYKGFAERKISSNYSIKSIENHIKKGLLVKVDVPNLNMFFVDQIRSFAHLVKVENQTKDQFLKSIETTYSTENSKTMLFYQATKMSVFNTIRLSENRSQILFNQ